MGLKEGTWDHPGLQGEREEAGHQGQLGGVLHGSRLGVERGHSHCQTEVLAGWAWEYLFPYALLVPPKGQIQPAAGPTGPEQDRQVEYSGQVTCARPVGRGPQQTGLSSGPIAPIPSP